MPTMEGITESSFSNNLGINIWRREAGETQLLLQVEQGKSPINKMTLEGTWRIGVFMEVNNLLGTVPVRMGML